MKINDQIRDEKLQYDINGEAAKVSALSSKKFNKYEYLTGEDLLLSNQKQMIEQAKFTYSLLGKAFEKQVKTTEDQGEKQIKALEDLKDNEKNKKQKQKQIYTDDYRNKLLISQERDIFKSIYNKIVNNIEELTKKIDNNDFYFIVISAGDQTDFSEVEDPITFLNNI